MAESGGTPGKKARRVLLKLSGESLQDRELGQSLSPRVLAGIAAQIAAAVRTGVGVALVTGGGNIFRGLSDSAAGMCRTTADYMGMLATVFNSLALQDALVREGLAVRLFSALAVDKLTEPVADRKPQAALERGEVVIFAAGTGNPYFTTDTAAALRAVESGADIVLKATRVDGVYDSDPEKNPQARLYPRLSYMDVIRHDLKVMDLTAVSLCRENRLPIGVFNMTRENAIFEALTGKTVGTMVTDQEDTLQEAP